MNSNDVYFIYFLCIIFLRGNKGKIPDTIRASISDRPGMNLNNVNIFTVSY